MYVDLGPDDYIEISLGGETHRYGPDRLVKVQRDDTNTRDNTTRYRYLTAVIPLHAEFPENTDHIRDSHT